VCCAALRRFPHDAKIQVWKGCYSIPNLDRVRAHLSVWV
jgi:hypothetical protein